MWPGRAEARDRVWIAAFAVFTVCYAFVASRLAAAKPFWHDEVYTIVISDLSSVATIWRAALDGIDLAPPLNTLLTHAVRLVAGTGLVTTRIIPIIGFWTMTLVVFDLVRRRSHVVAAVSAATLSCLTEAFRYSIEARSYGLMLALFALALWSWSEAARGRHRRITLPLLTVTLGAGIWNQYFAILAFVPIGFGEAVRLWRSRRIDWGVAGAIGCALAAALPLVPLMRVAARHSTSYWHHAGLGDIGWIYALLFRTLLGGFLPQVFALVALLVGVSAFMRSRMSVSGDYGDCPPHEVVAGLATVAVPMFAVLLAVYGTGGAFVPRYALGGVIGVSVTLPLAVARAGSHRRIADIVLATALLATFGASAYRAIVSDQLAYRDPLVSRPLLLESLERGDTVVVSGTTEYLQLWYYAPPELRPRLVYLANPAAALEQTGSDTLDRNYLVLSRWSRVQAREYESFTATHGTFTVADFGHGWLLAYLRKGGATLDEIGRDDETTLYQVALRRQDDGRVAQGPSVR